MERGLLLRIRRRGPRSRIAAKLLKHYKSTILLLTFIWTSYRRLPSKEYSSTDRAGVTYWSPKDLQLVISLEGADEGDGFLETIPIDQPVNREKYYPDDTGFAPEEAYHDKIIIPVSSYERRELYHYFYFRAKGHYGKGYWTNMIYRSINSQPPSATLSIRMVANPEAGNRKVATEVEFDGYSGNGRD